MNIADLFSSYFDPNMDDAELPPYFTLGAKQPDSAIVAMDSSDQSVITFDEYAGVAACRSGFNIMNSNQKVVYRSIGDIVYVMSNPTAPADKHLRAKLALDQTLRFLTNRRPFYSSLKSGPAMMPPRMVAARRRIVEDYSAVRLFANSAVAMPGMLFLADGRLNAQSFPGPAAIDLQARLLRSRGIRYVGITKGGLLYSVVQREARAIRKRVGVLPFAFSILPRHLTTAYREQGQTSSTPKVIRHGSSGSALGGVGAVRFGLSLASDHLAIVEMSLYDFEAFSGLVKTGERLEDYVARRVGMTVAERPAVYSKDVLQFVTECDWENHIVPTLEEIVFGAYTDTELGMYPRALADIHNRIKLRFDNPDLEEKRRHICNELARSGIPFESIPITLEGPHKWDPDEYNLIASNMA